MKITKIYGSQIAPNPRRVQFMIQYKGLDIPVEYIDLMKAQQLSPEFLAVNPSGTIPVAILDEGESFFTETLPILQLIESLYPEKPLFGGDIIEKTKILSWINTIYMQGFIPIAEVLRNGHPAFEGRALPGLKSIAQIPELVTRGKALLETFSETMDSALSGKEFLVNDKLSQADIDLFVMCEFSDLSACTIYTDQYPNLKAHAARLKELLS
ncbi:glutathione S-transferase [Sessilibacter sp. MAH1]